MAAAGDAPDGSDKTAVDVAALSPKGSAPEFTLEAREDDTMAFPAGAVDGSPVA